VTTEEQAEIRRLKKENAELRRTNEILRTASAFFAAELDRPAPAMIRYIDEHKDRFGVEGICCVLGGQLECGFMTASGYWAAKRREPAARTLSDRQLVPILERLHAADYGVYGVRKMWWLPNREGHQVGRDQVARLMRQAGLRRRRPRPQAFHHRVESGRPAARTTWCSDGSPPPRQTGCGWPT
jgi:putative transposase